MRTVLCLIAAFSGVCACCGGCAPDKQVIENENGPASIPSHLQDTVGEYAILTGDDMPVRGYGLLVGLGKSGSSEVPTPIRDYLEESLAKHGLGSSRLGTAGVTPAMVLDDHDTAAVLVGGAIPAGAPAGTSFDVSVAALPETQTRSLDGGILLGTPLGFAQDRKSVV